jgi:Predicted nucleotide-binding protein containing TIR-like domain
MERSRKPKVFIASSTEGFEIAESINVILGERNETILWKDIFNLSSNTLSDLVTSARSYDFAVFVFTPDDKAQIREQNKQIARDNVLFEFGLFVGTIGIERCFLVRPKEIELHIPSDLLGLNTALYEGERSEKDLRGALRNPCYHIQDRIKNLGLYSPNKELPKEEGRRTFYNYRLGNVEHRLLAELLESHAAFPNGVSVLRTFNSLRRLGRDKLGLATAKLEKMGYLSKRNLRDDEGEYSAFFITEDGINYMLQNDHLMGGSDYQVDAGSIAETSPDDDPPF